MSARRRGGKRSVSAAVSAIMADRDIEEQFRAMDASSPRVAAAPIPDAEAHGANPNAIEPKSLWTAGRASAASSLQGDSAEAAPWSPDAALVRKKFDYYDKDSSGNLDEKEILALAQVSTAVEIGHV
jgi:hypothetical protein